MKWKTRRREYWMGIPVANFDEVKAALTAYMNGVRGAHGAEQESLSGEGGGMVLALKTIAQHGTTDRFMSRMFSRLEPAMEPGGRGVAQADYDWDGVGPFTKTTVDLVRLSENQHMLGLHAAYVGRKGEAGLAAALGRERCLRWAEIGLEIETNGDEFRIDFDEIASRLEKVAPMTMTGAGIADHFMNQDEIHSKSCMMLRRANLNVRVGHQWLSSRLNYDAKVRPAPIQWKQKGAVLSGPLETRYKDETTKKPYPPTIEISVVSVGEHPAWKTEDKQDILDLADGIERIFAGKATKVESTY